VVGGGGGGIGRAISRGLAEAGAAVAVADVDPERAEEAAAETAGAGARAISLAGDVRSHADLDDMVTRAASELSGLDVLVTVVGGHVAFAPSAPLHETTDEDWDLIFDLNLRYVPRVVRAALRLFLAQGRGGSIVSVGSITGSMGSPMAAAYGAAKAGLASLARSVAAQHGALERARRHGIEPGDQRHAGAAARRPQHDPAHAAVRERVVHHHGEAQSLGIELLGPLLVTDRDRDHVEVADWHGTSVSHLGFGHRCPACLLAVPGGWRRGGRAE
jgi:3-oxoacyl-[acyl-carrier protein] reductase